MAVALQDTCLIALDCAKLQKSLERIEFDEMRERAKYLTDLPYLQMMKFN